MNKTLFRKTKAYFFLFFIFCISIGYSQYNTNYSEKYSSIDVSIKYFNKQIYYIGDPIIVEFQIVNNGSDPFLFITSYNKIFTFDFEISSFTNRMMEHSDSYAINRRKFEPVFNDEITLKTNEVYGVRIDISEWFNFNEPGEFVIKGVFYPKLITDSGKKILTEKELYLYLNPAFTEMAKEKAREKEIKRLKAESLPPYEVIDFMLKSIMVRDYEKYFLYINFEKFIQQFKNARKKYFDAKDIDKPEIIEEFKLYLMDKNTLEAVPYSDTIPIDFEIEKTVIEKRSAQVTVIETFKYLRLVEKKKYTYHLHLYGDKWLLEKYDVVNIGR